MGLIDYQVIFRNIGSGSEGYMFNLKKSLHLQVNLGCFL